ncbi:MAG: HD domain-containing protein [Kiritimatiellia bacterium]
MRELEWLSVQNWFRGYGVAFAGEDGQLHPMLQSKTKHSWRVSAYARDIALDIGCSPAGVLHAQTAGLLHDVGRFSQFQEFGTFHDPKSIDHGERGFTVLSADADFARLPVPKRDELLASVRYHNRRFLPQMPDEERRLTEIVRDADKLDIFKVILDSLKEAESQNKDSVFLNMAPDGPPNLAILECLRQGRAASYEDIRNRTDFGLQLLSWVFDLTFDLTCRRLVEQGLVEQLIARLPDDPICREAAGIARAQLRKRCEGG